MIAIQLNLSSVPFASPVTLSLIPMTNAYPIKVAALSSLGPRHIHSLLEKEREQTGTITHYCVWLQTCYRKHQCLWGADRVKPTKEFQHNEILSCVPLVLILFGIIVVQASIPVRIPTPTPMPIHLGLTQNGETSEYHTHCVPLVLILSGMVQRRCHSAFLAAE